VKENFHVSLFVVPRMEPAALLIAQPASAPQGLTCFNFQIDKFDVRCKSLINLNTLIKNFLTLFGNSGKYAHKRNKIDNTFSDVFWISFIQKHFLSFCFQFPPTLHFLINVWVAASQMLDCKLLKFIAFTFDLILPAGAFFGWLLIPIESPVFSKYGFQTQRQLPAVP